MTELDSWIGRQETATDEVTRPMARRVAALLNRSDDDLIAGAPLPPAWHAMLFTPIAQQSEIGGDGHPKLGAFLPPVPLPRRMFAGRRVTFHQPLKLGAAVTRVSEIAKIEPKQGRSGAMIFVTVIHKISGSSGIAITEEQDIVYREASGDGKTAAAAEAESPPAGKWQKTVIPDTVLVFRYSALTFNGHRIHYDRDYARDVEGYPDLLVNGGLTTLLLLDFAESVLGKPPTSLATRNRKPLFVNRPITLNVSPTDGGADLWAVDADGAVALEVSMTL